jgi:uncharacterized OsmC-like protein
MCLERCLARMTRVVLTHRRIAEHGQAAVALGPHDLTTMAINGCSNSVSDSAQQFRKVFEVQLSSQRARVT